MRLVILAVLSIILGSCENVSPIEMNSYSYNNVRTIRTVEEIPLTYRFDYPNTAISVPLLVIIDGSTCRGPNTSGVMNVLRPDSLAPKPYARLMVEKIGVGLEDDGKNCSDLFLQNYSIEDRIIQHLRALQHIRNKSPWWNGELLIWGWSDGGDIGAQLAAYYPNTTRSILGAMGGGLTMAESFRDVEFCPQENFQTKNEREICMKKLDDRYDSIRRNPKWNETWLGGDNTLKVWESRLFSRLSHLLKDNQSPMLIIHGTKDHGQIKSARKLRAELDANGNDAFTYWEIEGMGHSPRNMPVEQSSVLYQAMRDWLLIGDVPQPYFEALKSEQE